MTVARLPENNPFKPGFGAVPDVWAGRQAVLAQHSFERRARLLGRYTRGVMLIGPSGIGKSVLVNRSAEHSLDLGDVIVAPVRVAKRSDPVAHLAGAVAKAGESMASSTAVDAVEKLLGRLKMVSVRGVELAVTSGVTSNPHVELRDAIIALSSTLAQENAARAVDDERALVIRIDELQNASDTQRSAILGALGDALEHQVQVPVGDGANTMALAFLPLLVYLTGLPELVTRRTDVDTFRRRFSVTPLGMLSDGEVIDALTRDPLPGGVSVTPQAANAVADIVAGNPYLFQLVGQHAWNASQGPTITVEDVAAADDETYSERLRVVEAANDEIPRRESDVLDCIYAIAGSDLRTTSGFVAARMGMTPSGIAPYAQRLERRAAITREKGSWRIENRLLHRYRLTGDVLPVQSA